MNYLLKIDRNILKWAYQKPFDNTFLIRALIFIGDAPFWFLVLLFISFLGLLLNNENLFQLSIMIIINFALSNIIFNICKTRIKRKRPYANIELQKIINLTIDNRDPGHGSKEFESFFSGHVLWTTISVLLICFKMGYIYFLFIGWLIPVMIYLRLHLGVHYPSDVLAGFIIGFINTIITIFIFFESIDKINQYKNCSWFIYAYVLLVFIFLIMGFKSWHKRV